MFEFILVIGFIYLFIYLWIIGLKLQLEIHKTFQYSKKNNGLIIIFFYKDWHEAFEIDKSDPKFIEFDKKVKQKTKLFKKLIFILVVLFILIMIV